MDGLSVEKVLHSTYKYWLATPRDVNETKDIPTRMNTDESILT